LNGARATGTRAFGFAFAAVVAATGGVACGSGAPSFDPRDPARGPGGQAGGKVPVSAGDFEGDGTANPAAAPVPPPAGGGLPSCDVACESYCAVLGLKNPVDAGACRVLWGVGLDTRPMNADEACVRLHIDLAGRRPTGAEAAEICGGRTPGEIARDLMERPAFAQINQRRWADLLRYNNEAVSVERIYDADRLIGKLYRGEVAYDEAAAVMSAHPVITRRHANPGDRAEAVFSLFVGRPPSENERSDLARLYTLWGNGYYDHPQLGSRLPDAVIQYRCLGPDGAPDPATRGECTSVLWGYNELILEPDIRARGEGQQAEMWSGLLRSTEWERLMVPGRILAREPAFWEHAADDVLRQYLGYDLGASAPAVRQQLAEFVIRHGGDIRAAHYAVVTSQIYLQSSGGDAPAELRFTVGPLKQIDAEGWIDGVKVATGLSLAECDHRLPEPDQLLESGSLAALALVEASRWQVDSRGRVVGDYRDLARTLGGCPENQVGGRFKTVSVLNTAVQEGVVLAACNPTLDPEARGAAAVERLLPPGVAADRALDADLAESIVAHQTRTFTAREATPAERAAARVDADACVPKPCTAEAFARPACYALLSSSELLFY